MAVTDHAILMIKDMIFSGELRPGDRLPREGDLAARLGLSRSSLREAIKALSLMSVLDVRQGDGTFVTDLDAGMLSNALSFVVDLHHGESVLHLLEVRRLLEPAAAALAASQMTDEQLDELDAILDGLGSSPTVDELVASDQDFHRRIAEAAGNPVLSSIIVSLSGPTQRARTWRGLDEESAVEQSLSEHRHIVASLRTRNADAARAWATIHIIGVENWLHRALELGPEASGPPRFLRDPQVPDGD
jgi:DNA-binding FadR family transcriptional regulator